MKQPCYIDLTEARNVLAEVGINLSVRQLQRASEKDAHGNRKLPFFVDPIENKLRIERGTLVGIYRQLQMEAENTARVYVDFSCSKDS